MLGGVQPSGATAPVPHVQSGGEPALCRRAVGRDAMQAGLRAGSDIRFDGAIDADGAGRSLDVTAGGTTTFARRRRCHVRRSTR